MTGISFTARASSTEFGFSKLQNTSVHMNKDVLIEGQNGTVRRYQDFWGERIYCYKNLHVPLGRWLALVKLSGWPW